MSQTHTTQAESRPARAFGALQHRDFRVFWAGACISFIGSWVQIVTMGWLVYQMTGSKAALGIIGLAGGLPVTLLMLFGGVIADRANKRVLVLTTQVLFSLNAFALALLTGLGIIQVWHIVALSFLNGVLFAADGPARQSIVYDLVGPDDLAAGVALQSAAFNVARVIGPIIGSLIYGALGPAWCFALNGVTFAAIVAAVLLIRTDIGRRTEPTDSVWDSFVEGLRHLRSNRTLLGVVSLTAVTSVLAFSSYATLMPALAQDQLRVSESRYGLLFSVIGLGSLAGAYLVGRAAAAGRRGALMATGACLFAVTLLGLAAAASVAVALVLLFLLGMAAICELATANTLTQSLAPDSLRGRAVAAHMFAMAGLQPFGALLAGTAAERFGVPATLAGSAVLFWILALALFATRPEILRLE